MFAAPAATATMSDSYTSRPPPRDTTTPVTVRPVGSVSSFTASASTSRVTFGWSRAGRTAMTSASDLAWTRHGYPSHQVHRMHVLLGRSASSSMIPHGAWNGW